MKIISERVTWACVATLQVELPESWQNENDVDGVAFRISILGWTDNGYERSVGLSRLFRDVPDLD